MVTVSVLVLALILSLTACGGNDTHNASSTQDEKVEKTENSATTETAEKVTEDTQYCDQADCRMMFPHAHISMDNWQEYFEFKIDYQFGNGIENMDKFLVAKTVFNVREEWLGKIENVDLQYQVGYTEYSVSGNIDWDNQTVTIEDGAEKVYSSHIQNQWYDAGNGFDYSFDEDTGLPERTNMASITNNREDYDGTICIWEPEMLNIGNDCYITLKE